MRVFAEIPQEVGGVHRAIHRVAGDAVVDVLVVASGSVRTHRGKHGEVRLNLAVGVLVDCGALSTDVAGRLTGKDYSGRQLSLV